jgi:polyisoprenoid-binding protein YceI
MSSLERKFLRALRVAPLIIPCVAAAAPRAVVPEEAKVEFVVRQMGVPVPGRFQRFNAVIDIDPASPDKSSANVSIDIGSLTTGNEEADALAVGPDWLDKARAPFATFKTTSVRALGGGRYEARGPLTIRNSTHEVVVPLSTSDQAGGRTLVTAEFVVRRSEYGIGGGVWNKPGVVAEEIPVKVRFMLAESTAKPAAGSR